MAIKSNRKVDFEYEFESQDSPYSIMLRFHHTDEYGPTISVLGEDGEPVISFPVGMFAEVTEFLVDQGILEGKKALTVPQVPQRLPKTTTAQTPTRTSLPKPNIAMARSTINPLKIGSKQIKDVVKVDLEEDGDEFSDAPDDMRETLRAEQDRLKGIQEAIEGSVPAQSLSTPADQVELSDEELNRMLEERQSALSKSKPTGKTLRKVH